MAERETTATGQERGLLHLVYDEEYGDFEGTIQVTLLLSDGTRCSETILDVDLAEGEENTWVLSDPGLSWLEVKHVWVELVPAT